MPYTQDYAQETGNESWEGRVLLEFGTDWCPICQAIQPDLKELVQDRDDLRHVKIEDGKGRPLGRSFSVKLWPNFVLMQDGEVLAQLARPTANELRHILS